MIARDGFPFIFIGFILTVIFVLMAVRWGSYWLFTLGLIFAVLTVFTTFFFRDPSRHFTPEPGIIVAPADGKVVAVDTLDNHPYVGERAVKISIFLSVFDVHINRIPTDGTIDYVKYNPGKFFAAYRDKASELNEQTEIGIITGDGTRLIVKQIAGVIARRIVCNLTEGETVTAGKRFGMIRFGSRTDLILPAGSDINITLGEHVTGSKTIIGYLKNGVFRNANHEETNGKNVKL